VCKNQQKYAKKLGVFYFENGVGAGVLRQPEKIKILKSGRRGRRPLQIINHLF